MKIFSALYDRVLRWSAHPHAPRYLGGLSFAESSFFPIPPDVMLAPMTLAKPEKAHDYAALTTIASVLGGVLGWLIGFFAIEMVEPLIEQIGYMDKYQRVVEWFAEWGFWAILIAGFSPIPYKLFTIAGGALGIGLLPFILASFIGRGARFYLVAFAVAWGGPKVAGHLREYVDRIGWISVLLILIAYFVFAR